MRSPGVVLEYSSEHEVTKSVHSTPSAHGNLDLSLPHDLFTLLFLFHTFFVSRRPDAIHSLRRRELDYG